MKSTPPLLRKMMEDRVGDLVVFRDRIVEPRSMCCVAHSFPSREGAIKAATEMNEVADWVGVLKARADGRRPNCQVELQRIAEANGGKLGDGSTDDTVRRCAEVTKGL